MSGLPEMLLVSGDHAHIRQYFPNQAESDSRHELSWHRAVMRPEQCRAARGWLGWSRDDLARQANVSLRTVAAFERHETTPQPNNLAAMRRAIEAAGVRLVFDKNGAAAGILRQDANPDLSGETPT